MQRYAVWFGGSMLASTVSMLKDFIYEGFELSLYTNSVYLIGKKYEKLINVK